MTTLISVVTNSEKQINLNLNENLNLLRVCFIKILIIPNCMYNCCFYANIRKQFRMY